MSELQKLQINADGETYEIYIETKTNPSISEPTDQETSQRGGAKGISNIGFTHLQEVRKTIRGYAAYVLNAFKDFGVAEVEEVTLKFGIKIGGKAGIPYITEGTAESNLEVEVKCKFPPQQTH
ncbi:conserved hypothetical protein [Gloeothece citriformis PCC 7424]|uniref:Trypsin-co-occurring domain-containing protein n=1 Tax=Gloeothece citriformis (strain PCC 7424) TaxID=65393 RepID=B7KGN4_GLOC7|nr:CU044_2847 family protein [Gloeothece citriformis]ACK71961.1 conserved hypothetical protein [Gloeothece citriformis PCC 7424]